MIISHIDAAIFLGILIVEFPYYTIDKRQVQRLYLVLYIMGFMAFNAIWKEIGWPMLIDIILAIQLIKSFFLGTTCILWINLSEFWTTNLFTLFRNHCEMLFWWRLCNTTQVWWRFCASGNHVDVRIAHFIIF